MRHASYWAGLLLVPFLALPAFADDKKDNDKDPHAPTRQDYAALKHAGVAIGKIANFDKAGKTFTLQIEYDTPAGNPEAQLANLLRDQERLLNEQTRVLQARDVVTQQRRLMHLLQEAQRQQVRAVQGVKVKKDHRD